GHGVCHPSSRLDWTPSEPGPFNAKEHAAIALMASAASQSALATEALAVQQLYYGGYPSHAAGVFITLSSQLIGYGIAGLLRDIIVRPTKMLWPMTLPISSLLESLHKNKQQSKARLKVFYIVFFILFFWEIVPEVCSSMEWWLLLMLTCVRLVHFPRAGGCVHFLPCKPTQPGFYQPIRRRFRK
ncbi:Peptide transporter MTD1, partial [Rasamsonia emersonii CBS 393.64]